MAEYQPFLISNFKTAKSIGLEPWLSPADAFPTLFNMQVNKGVLEKRLGFAPFATMKHGAVEQSNTTITGIKVFEKNGMPTLLIMDTKRVNKYSAVDGTMSDISGGSNIFSGESGDHFSFTNWLDRGYMVNNVNQIFQYTGSGDVSVFDVPLDSGETVNQVQTCRFIFIKDDRMLLLEPVEKGSYQSARCRFSPVLSTDFTASGAGFVDAETEQRISAAGFVGKDIAVYFEGATGGSLWRIRTTGDSLVPFKWERVTPTEGCRAPYSGVEFNDGLAAIGLSNVLFYDGFRKIQNLELPHLRDILSEFNDSVIRSVSGYNQNEVRHLLFGFADSGSSTIDRILDYNELDKNWTVHKSGQSFFFNVFGGFNEQKVPTMVELDDVITFDGDTVANMTVDSRAVLGNPKPITLIGARNSQVYKWNSGDFDGTDTAAGNIAIDAQSARLNPFVKDGRKVALEKIEFYVDNDSTASFTAALHKDTSTSSYKSQSLSADLSNGKDFVTLFADGEIGKFHRLKISHTARSNRPRIHAMIWYMKPAGRLTL